MKIMNKILILAGIAAALMVNVDCFGKKRATASIQANTQGTAISEPLVVEATEEVKVATGKAKVAIADAEQKIAAIRGQLQTGDISPVDAAKSIGELNYAIEQEKKQLAEFVGKKVETVETAEAQEKGYVSRFISGAKDLGASIIAPLKSGYGYSEKEQAIARAIIAELQKQLEEIEAGYAVAKEQANVTDKNQMKRDYDAIIQTIEAEIRNQQVITGEVMSRNRKLFWAAVGTAGALAAGAAAQYYLTPGAGVTDVTTDMGSTTELGLPMEPAPNQTQTLSEFLTSRTPNQLDELARSESLTSEEGLPMEPASNQTQTLQDFLTSRTPKQLDELARSESLTSENNNIQDLDFEQNVGTPEAREELRSMVKETAQQGASVGASLAEQAKQNVGEELTARRHHPSPLTPRQAWDKASSWVSEKAENVKDALFGSSVPSDAEAAGEYFAETYGSPATQAINKGLERVGQEISASSVPSDEEAAGEYFVKEYGPSSTEAINTGLQEGKVLARKRMNQLLDKQ